MRGASLKDRAQYEQDPTPQRQDHALQYPTRRAPSRGRGFEEAQLSD
jgi:hypothetical protein